jgi:FixJ family two-component response regulator
VHAVGSILISDQKKNVAIVDDDPEIRASISTLLSALGYCASTFDSAETFLCHATTCRARCLLVDIELGDISGLELARQLAADGFSYPIIFMTGLVDPVIQSQADAAGGVAFLQKPFRAQALIDAVEKAVG